MRIVAGLLCAIALAMNPSIASAALSDGDNSAVIRLLASVRGELTDGYVDRNPCADNEPHTEFFFEDTWQARSGTVTYTFDASSNMTPESQSARWFVSGTGFGDTYSVISPEVFSTVTITEKRYLVGCRDPETHEIDPGTDGISWVPVISEVTLIPAVMAELVRLVPAPEVFFPVADPVYGWLYVKTPMEVRVSNLDEVSAEVTAANAVSSATATATAVPVEVVFESGEPGGGRVVCSVEAVQMGWDRNDPDGSGCVYSYANSSAVTPSDRFQAHTVVRWHVTGTGGLDMTIVTEGFDVVAVAEVQAVVVAP